MSTGSHILKMCTRCGKVKPLKEFYKRWTSRKNRHEQCAACKTELRHEQEALRGEKYSTEWKRKNRVAYFRGQDKYYAKKRGLTWEQYMLAVKEQDGLCAICGKPNTMKGKDRRLTIDHDHKTEQFRGLICQPCNFGLGGFRDNPESLLAAVRYLGYADYAITFDPIGLGC
jgi:hypothetical protein